MNSGKFLLINFTLMGLISCSGYQFKKSETIDQKMSRYESRDYNNTAIPQIGVFEHQFSSRGIASQPFDPTPLEGHSNKRVYFLTLLSQYNTMKSFSKADAPEIGICPNFHTPLINNSFHLKVSKRQNFERTSFDSKSINPDKINNPEYAAMYPELFLPLSHVGSHPSVIDSMTKDGKNKNESRELIDQAYAIHLEKTYQELINLCQHGQSSNYYIFENLVTYVKSHPKFKRSSESIKALFKTTIFSNMALIQSMEIGNTIKQKGRSIASTQNNYSIFEKEVFNRLDVNWARDYFLELKNKRNIKDN